MKSGACPAGGLWGLQPPGVKTKNKKREGERGKEEGVEGERGERWGEK